MVCFGFNSNLRAHTDIFFGCCFLRRGVSDSRSDFVGALTCRGGGQRQKQKNGLVRSCSGNYSKAFDAKIPDQTWKKTLPPPHFDCRISLKTVENQNFELLKNHQKNNDMIFFLCFWDEKSEYNIGFSSIFLYFLK